MSRTAKKRIEVRDEGAVIAVDTDSLDFVGTGITASAILNDVEVESVGGASSPEIPTGTINGINNIFTVLNTPKYIVVDGLVRRETKGYTYSAGTITVDPLQPPVYDIFSYY